MTTNNHPAHGPVSLDRLHQIREILSKAAAQSDGGNLGYAMADAVKVIKGAIAAFGAGPAPVDIEMLATVLRNAPLAPSDRQGRPRAPVVPEECKEAPAYVKALTKEGAYIYGFNACRAAMQSFGNSEKLDEVGSWNNHMNTPTAKPAIDTGELLKRIEGMEVSVDISTCDADAGHRYFGTVTEISELDTAKNGYILLVQDAKPNFKPAGNSPVTPDCWIPVSERMPEEGGRYWCYVEEQNSLGKSHYQWNCSWNGEVWSDKALSGRVTHWMPLPAAPQQEVKS
ncbi:DUF551 domain-containing protein [Salmonella enterica]|nr:DUF551 domain-containing protein [Salmonella enterica]